MNACCDWYRGGPDPTPSGDACEVVLAPVVGDNGAFINTVIGVLAGAGGGTICLSPGVYACTTSIQPLSNVSIKGEGVATIVTWAAGHIGTDPNTNRSLISFIAANAVVDVDIYNFLLDGLSGNTTTTEYCVRIDQAQRIRLRQMRFLNATLDGVHVTANPASVQTQVVQVERCFETNSGRDAVRIESADLVDVVSCVHSRPIRMLPASALQVVSRVNVRGVVTEMSGPFSADWSVDIQGGVGQGDVRDIKFVACETVTGGHAARVSGVDVDRVVFEACTWRTGMSSATGTASFLVQNSADCELDDCYVEITSYSTDGDVVGAIGAGVVDVHDCRLIGTTNNAGRETVAVTTGLVMLSNNRIIGPVSLVGSAGVDMEDNIVDLQGTLVRPAITIDGCTRTNVRGGRTLGGSVGIQALGVLVDVAIEGVKVYDFDLIGIDLASATSTTRVQAEGNTVRSADPSVTQGITLDPRSVCRKNYVEVVGTGGVGTAGISGAADCVVTANVVRHGNLANSILFGAVTGYVSSFNQLVVAGTYGGTPSQATDDALIAV